MDKETVKRLAEINGLWPEYDDIQEHFIDGKELKSDIIAFAQACFNAGCEVQKEHYAQICEELGDRFGGWVLRNVATKIRNAKESPESDIERVTNLR